MTVDREARSGEGEQDEQPVQESGRVYVDWQPVEGAKDHSQRVDDVERVEVREPADPEGYDEGEVVLHTEDGVCVFDRNGMRGFRTHGAVAVPEYDSTDSSDDSSDTGAEQ